MSTKSTNFVAHAQLRHLIELNATYPERQQQLQNALGTPVLLHGTLVLMGRFCVQHHCASAHPERERKLSSAGGSDGLAAMLRERARKDARKKKLEFNLPVKLRSEMSYVRG
eukprot:6213009-Pleurochrysis_carterae.AAC.3